MRRHVRLVGALGILAALVGILLLPGAWVARGASRPGTTHPAAVAPTPCATTSPWAVASTPNTPGGVLRATAATSRSDVWAVGYDYNSAMQGNQTLIEHWNGSTWSIVPSPDVGTGANQLYGVAAISSNDAWAVGYYTSSQNVALTLTMHWDGTQWSIIASPNPGGSGANGYLAAVSAVAANDVWAVGFYLDTIAHNDRTLTEHWDGTQWSIILSANPGAYPNDLLSVAAISSNDVWAVGFYYDVNNFVGALMEHWDGTSWTALPSLGDGTQLFAVAAASSNDVWGVGIQEASGGVSDTLTAHWDGTSWSIAPTPGMTQGILSAVTVISSTDVWAAGGPNGYGVPALTEHWNGSQWSVVPIRGTASLNGLAAIAPNDVWAVGTDTSGSGLIEHYPNLFQGAPASRATPHIGPRSPGGAIPCP